MLHMPCPMLLQAADAVDPRAEAYIASVGTFTAARAAIVRKLFADMGAAADKLRFLYLCAAHDLAAATRNVMNPASDPITSSTTIVRQADQWLSGNVAYDEYGDPYAIEISHSYGSRMSGLGGGNLFAGQYLAPRNGPYDPVAAHQSFSLPAPANVFYKSGFDAAKRIEITYPGQGTVVHGDGTNTLAPGFMAFGRNGSSSLGWVDGVPANSSQNTGQPTINFAASGARGYVSFSLTLRVSIHCRGETRTDAEVAVLNTAFRNYLSAIGASVA